MEVYHASNCIIEKPDTLHSRQFLDFGPGFYITTMYDQAEKYAARFVRRGKQAFINTYALLDDLSAENGAYPPNQNGLIHPQLSLKWA